MDRNWKKTRDFCGVPNGIRTHVLTLRGSCPRPLDDRDFVEM